MKLFTVALLLSLAFIALAVDETHPIFHRMFEHTCNGKVRFFPHFQMLSVGGDFTLMSAVIKEIYSLMNDRINCACPSGLTENQKQLHYFPSFPMLLRNIQGRRFDGNYPNPCDKLDPMEKIKELWDTENFIADMSTCDLSKWTTQGCRFRVHYDFGSNTNNDYIWFTAQPCDNYPLPYLSVGCAGEKCKAYMKPCDQDADCAVSATTKLFCNDIINTTKFSLKDMNLFNKDDLAYLNPLCTGLREDYFLTSIREAVFKMYRSTVAANPGPKAKFCGLNKISSYDNIFEHFLHLNITDAFSVTGQKVNVTSCGNGYCSVTQQENNTLVVKPGFIQPFDGMVDGVQVDSTDRKNPVSVPELTLTPLPPHSDTDISALQFTCETAGFLLPSTRLRVAARHEHLFEIFDTFKGIINKIETCRFKLHHPTTSETEIDRFLRTRFVEVESILYKFLNHVPAVSVGKPELVDWIHTAEPLDFAINMPASCSYSRWNTDGKCGFLFDGLTSLLGVKLELRVHAERCDNPPTQKHFPNIHLDCVGDGCQLLGVMKGCKTNANCPSGLVCFDWRSELTKDGDIKEDIFLPWKNANTPNTCYSVPKFWTDISTLISKLSDADTSDGKIRTCFIDINRVNSTGETWAKGAYSKTNTSAGEIITFRDLKEFYPVDGNVTDSAQTLVIYGLLIVFCSILNFF